MIWIGMIIGGVVGFVACAIFAGQRIAELESQLGRGPLCSACQTAGALDACRADCKAHERVSVPQEGSAAMTDPVLPKLPCPFCGMEPMLPIWSPSERSWASYCATCEYFGPAGESPKMANAAWDTRVQCSVVEPYDED